MDTCDGDSDLDRMKADLIKRARTVMVKEAETTRRVRRDELKKGVDQMKTDIRNLRWHRIAMYVTGTLQALVGVITAVATLTGDFNQDTLPASSNDTAATHAVVVSQSFLLRTFVVGVAVVVIGFGGAMLTGFVETFGWNQCARDLSEIKALAAKSDTELQKAEFDFESVENHESLQLLRSAFRERELADAYAVVSLFKCTVSEDAVNRFLERLEPQQTERYERSTRLRQTLRELEQTDRENEQVWWRRRRGTGWAHGRLGEPLLTPCRSEQEAASSRDGSDVV